MYKVKLINKKNNETLIIEAPDDEYLIDVANDEYGWNIPRNCDTAECCSCKAKVIEGVVDQADQLGLEEEDLEKGYVLLCAGFPLSDCIIETHIETSPKNSSDKLITELGDIFLKTMVAKENNDKDNFDLLAAEFSEKLYNFYDKVEGSSISSVAMAISKIGVPYNTVLADIIKLQK